MKQLAIIFLAFYISMSAHGQLVYRDEVIATLKEQILKKAAWALNQKPETVTALLSPRSAGGKHDFYSEGDYWWPDPKNPDGPYIQKDGESNPENFVSHRHAMIRFSKIMGALCSAYMITSDEKLVKHAVRHAKAWFVDTATMMNPSLLYAQAIKGRFTGRGIGIIDGVHLIEVAQALRKMEQSNKIDRETLLSIKKWFSDFTVWMTTHQYGIDEMNAENNHGTCWVMQVAAFAKFTNDQSKLNFCKNRFKNVLLPNQMADDGSFPRELKRTKPYGYSLFNLDAMTMICQILSDEKEHLWKYETPDGKSVAKGIQFLFPYVKDKSKWPYSKDVMYWHNWPIAHPFLVFGAQHYNKPEWFEEWKKLDHDPQVKEVIRNLPVRNPLIWMDK
jgi:hypothetical protein